MRFEMQKVAIAVSDQLTKIAVDGKYNTEKPCQSETVP